LFFDASFYNQEQVYYFRSVTGLICTEIWLCFACAVWGTWRTILSRKCL